MQRHSWKDLSRRVSICIHCGGKRIREKQAGPWRTSVPDFHYEFPEGQCVFAGVCSREWPLWWEVEWRGIYKREPAQAELFK